MTARDRSVLPSPSTTFIGRREELDAIDRELAGGRRLVTLLGSGGTGKTRLAIEYARREQSSRGAWFCDLTEVRDADGLAEIVSRALAIEGERGAPDAIGAAIAQRGEILVVLDNAEQIAALLGGAVAGWLVAAPAARFLVTSRERLGAEGETCIGLEPLPVPGAGDEHGLTCDAVRLFLDRARLARPDVTIEGQNGADLVAIVRALDGIPLAIELCAARAGVLGLKQLRGLLDRRLDAFADAKRARHPRHATLRAAVDWSWSLLTPDEQDALRQCSVFRGGFSLEAAQAVVMPDGERGHAMWALEAIQALFDKSLIVSERSKAFEGERRYRLFDTIRDFAAERLDASGRAAEVRDRHAKHYVAEAARWTEAARTQGASEPRRRLEIDLENLIAACDHLRATGSIEGAAEILVAAETLFIHAPPKRFFHRARPVLDELANAKRTGDVRARLASVIGAMMIDLGDLAEGKRHFELALSEGLADDSGKAYALASLGLVAGWEGRFADAERLFEEAEPAARRGPDRGRESRVARYVGAFSIQSDRPDRARAYFERALELARSEGARFEEAAALRGLGNLGVRTGDLDRAEEAYLGAIAAFEELEDQSGRATALLGHRVIAQERGRFDEARAGFEEALEAFRRSGHLRGAAITIGHLGRLALEQGRADEAAAYFRDAASRMETVGLSPNLAFALAAWAAADARRGLFDEARAHLDRAKTVAASARVGSVARAIALFEGLIAVAEAERAATRGDVDAAVRGVARAKLALDAKDPGARSDETRFAERVLEASLAALADRGAEWVFSPDTMLIEENGAWFGSPGKARVQVEHRQASARILAVLAKSRVEHPGQPVGADVLAAAAWPGERALASAIAARLHVAVSTLRKLGLTVLRRNGYLLDPDRPLHVISDKGRI